MSWQTFIWSLLHFNFQIRSEVASLPLTRLAMRLPSIGFHFSPSRYHRLMQVVKIFKGDDADHSALVRPWDEADYVGWLYHLARKVDFLFLILLIVSDECFSL